MAQFSDLVGEHHFPIVPATIRHPIDSDASGILFTLGETTYLVFEDPSDGYRSTAAPILSYTGSAYEMGGGDYSFPTYIREDVVCTHRTKAEYGGEDDVLEVRSKVTGKLIFEVGTSNVDDYYPSYTCRWDPTGLSANAQKEAAE